jgi:hypothetical protein
LDRLDREYGACHQSTTLSRVHLHQLATVGISEAWVPLRDGKTSFGLRKRTWYPKVPPQLYTALGPHKREGKNR